MYRSRISILLLLALALTLGVCQTISADTIYNTTVKGTPGLVGYYQWDASYGLASPDTSGHSNDGTFTGPTTWTTDTPGPGSSHSLTFAGSSYVSGNIIPGDPNAIPPTPPTWPGTGFPTGYADRTAILWMKVASGTANPGATAIVEFGTEGTVHEAFHLGVLGDKAFFGDWGAGATSATSVTDNKWHMLTLTLSGGTPTNAPTWSLYIDGSATADTVVTGATWWSPANTVLDTTNGWRIGAGAGAIPGYVGSVDEVAYFASALTTGQRQAIYSAMPVPEPGTLALLATGLLGLLAYAWRKRR